MTLRRADTRAPTQLGLDAIDRATGTPSRPVTSDGAKRTEVARRSARANGGARPQPATSAAKPIREPHPPNALRGDLDWRNDRSYVKLDRLGGDLFGLKRAVLALGAGVGDFVLIEGDDWVTQRARVVSLETGREGEIEIDLDEHGNGPTTFRGENIRRVTVRS